jgi:organic hydroperoxide reductase OsmC/OhrA
MRLWSGAAAKTQGAATEVRIQKPGVRIIKELQNADGGEKRPNELFALASKSCFMPGLNFSLPISVHLRDQRTTFLV